MRQHLEKENRDAIWEKFMGLNEQCKIISFIVDEAFVSDITNWKKVTNKLPGEYLSILSTLFSIEFS